MDDLAVELADIARPIVEAEEAELVGVEVKGHPGSRLVRLVVDVEGGIDIDTIASLSRNVGAAFDDADAVTGRYTLEVTSPGADRPLRTEADFSRNVGRRVRIRTQEEEIIGEVAAVSAEAVTVDVEGRTVDVPLGAITQARVVLPW